MARTEGQGREASHRDTHTNLYSEPGVKQRPPCCPAHPEGAAIKSLSETCPHEAAMCLLQNTGAPYLQSVLSMPPQEPDPWPQSPRCLRQQRLRLSSKKLAGRGRRDTRMSRYLLAPKVKPWADCKQVSSGPCWGPALEPGFSLNRKSLPTTMPGGLRGDPEGLGFR